MEIAWRKGANYAFAEGEETFVSTRHSIIVITSATREFSMNERLRHIPACAWAGGKIVSQAAENNFHTRSRGRFWCAKRESERSSHDTKV